ncbi:MAG: GNAT family N-acetyltransferase [Ferruginibacter sp.]
MTQLLTITTDEQYAAAAQLFQEYATWLGIDLCFQGFEEEVRTLKKMYGPPNGGIVLCEIDGKYIGCVGIRKIDKSTAELKRMYVQPHQQQKGIGTAMLEKAFQLARDCGYQKIKLDTLNTMKPAMDIYLKNGFKEIPAYYHNPIETAVYFEKIL